MPKPEDCFFVAFDKTPIHYRVHETPGERRASLLLVHGAGEYPGRYDEFAAFLTRRGIAVYALGLRGHGKSGGERAYVRDFSDFTKDVLALAAKIRGDSPRPVFMLGHSMGGLIAACAAAEAGTDLRGVVLSSPFFGLALELPSYLKTIAAITARIYPKFTHATTVPSDVLTHDAEAVRRHRADPEITRVVTSGLFANMLRASDRYAQIAGSIRCAMLIAQAGEDRVVDAAHSKRFFDAVASPDKQFKLYDGLYHEVLNETSRQTVYDDILHWIEKRLS